MDFLSPVKDDFQIFFFEIKINSLTSVSLAAHELSVSLYELDEFFKISLGNRL